MITHMGPTTLASLANRVVQKPAYMYLFFFTMAFEKSDTRLNPGTGYIVSWGSIVNRLGASIINLESYH